MISFTKMGTFEATWFYRFLTTICTKIFMTMLRWLPVLILTVHVTGIFSFSVNQLSAQSSHLHTMDKRLYRQVSCLHSEIGNKTEAWPQCCQCQRGCQAIAFRMGLFDSILGGSDTGIFVPILPRDLNVLIHPA
jgi:hypothetical protein